MSFACFTARQHFLLKLTHLDLCQRKGQSLSDWPTENLRIHIKQDSSALAPCDTVFLNDLTIDRVVGDQARSSWELNFVGVPNADCRVDA